MLVLHLVPELDLAIESVVRSESVEDLGFVWESARPRLRVAVMDLAAAAAAGVCHSQMQGALDLDLTVKRPVPGVVGPFRWGSSDYVPRLDV